MTQIKAVLKRSGCIRHLPVDALIVTLGVNPTKYIMTLYKTDIKDIKNRLGDLIYPTTPHQTRQSSKLPDQSSGGPRERRTAIRCNATTGKSLFNGT